MDFNIKDLSEISRVSGILVDRLSLLETSILSYLKEQKGSDLRVSDIARYMDFSSSAASQILKKLAKVNLVRFDLPENFDKRSMCVYITDDGLGRLEKVLIPGLEKYFQERKLEVDKFNKDVKIILKKLKGVRDGSKE